MSEIDFRYSKKADKFFQKHIKVKEKFIQNIIQICRGDQNVDVKPLKGYENLLRMRIGDYRVVYRIANGNIIIVDVILAGSRGEIYKKI